MDYNFLLEIALILLATKVAGVLFKNIGLPQVLGSLVVGIIFGVSGIVKNSSSLQLFAQIGVILIMFTAGMETNFKELKDNAAPSLIITLLGVILPFLFGFGIAFIIPNISMKMRMFFGVILMATSVGITVATLRELNVLHGKVGGSVVTAAVLDDIIGIVVLAFFTADTSSTTIGGKIGELLHMGENLSFLIVLINVLLFFIAAIGVGIGIHYLFKFMSKKWPHTRRLSIFSLGICFLYAWACEKLFGIAAITGAFLAGMMIANMKQTDYVESRVEMTAYMIFSPMFFVYIGVSLPYNTLISSFSWQVVVFSLAFIVAGLLGKVLGAGIGAKICGYRWDQSFKVGVSMMVRGEVCLIIANEGVVAGIMDQTYYPAIVLLILISSILTPLILKYLFKKWPNVDPVEGSYSEQSKVVDITLKREGLSEEISQNN